MTLDIKTITIKRHSTPESIFAAHWLPVLAPETDLSSGSYGYGDTEYTYADCIERIRRERIWAFADIPNREIHIWYGGCNADKLAKVLGHEYGHFANEAVWYDEEMQADAYGDIAVAVMREIELVCDAMLGIADCEATT